MPRWQRELLPAMLGADHLDRDRPGEHLRRSLRDWVVDLTMFGFALAVGAAGAWHDAKAAPSWLLIADIVIGLVVCASLWVRRDHPLVVGTAAIAAAAISGQAGGAAIVAMFTVAIYCAPRRTVQLVALSFASNAICPAVYMRHDHYGIGTLVVGLFATIVAAAWGSFVRVRRELVLSLHERNRELRAEQELRLQEARRAERDRIAREMHDVLAHRISLLGLHAGALEFNPDASEAEIAQAAAVIRTSARAAQEELREVIGVLRTDTTSDQLAPPQPTLCDVPRLIDESRRAGVEVTLENAVDVADAVPPTLGRTVYRFVQEGLTNARKHAPGQPVTVRLDGDPDSGIALTIVNRPPVGQAPLDAPVESPVGSGMGLIGLRERVELARGALEHGPLPGGGFRLQATLPWP